MGNSNYLSSIGTSISCCSNPSFNPDDDEIDQQILDALDLLHYNIDQAVNCSELMTINTFIDLIDEVKRITALRAEIAALQVELGFDDDVAAYVLENAPDGCDIDCLLNQIHQGIFSKLDEIDQSDIDFLKNSPELWGYILNPDNQFDDINILGILINYLRDKYETRNSPYNQTNQCEKDLIDSHPLSASYLGANWLSANLLTKYMTGVNGTNDCSDAYRHVLFNALNSVFLGEDLARSFGEAHECVFYSYMSKDMDLHNNEIGYSIIANDPVLKFQLTQTDTPGWAMDDLLSNICTSLAIGELLVFSHPDAPASFPDNMLVNSNCSCLH